MKGRYERPKQSRFGKKNKPVTPVRNQDPYGRAPQGNPGGYPGGYPEGDMGDYGRYNPDPYGGQVPYPYQGGSTSDPSRNKGGFGWALLGFFLPLIGLILFLCWKRTKPGKARSAGRGALIGFIVGLVLTVLVVVLGSLGLSSFMNGMFDSVNQVNITVTYPPATQAIQETEVTQETETVETTEPPHVASREDYINILVAGQSSRGAEDKEQARFADSMMLLTLNKYDKTVTMTSLLRDALVKMPDYKGHTGGRIKLTTIYHLGYVYSGNQIAGSMELMDMALYNNFGIEVDYNFEIDFYMFEQIINMLGGVDIVIDEAEANYLTKSLSKYLVYGTIQPGKYSFDGFSGLAFARMRHAEGDGDSDIKRTGRQQRFVKALLDKISQKSITELQSIAKEVLPLVSTSMSTEEMTDLMKLMLPMLKDLKLVSGGTCPANYKGEMLDIYKDGMLHSVLRFNEQETKDRMRELTLGELPANGQSVLTTEPVEVTDPSIETRPRKKKKKKNPEASSEAAGQSQTGTTVPSDGSAGTTVPSSASAEPTA